MDTPPFQGEGPGASSPPAMHVGDISPRLNSATRRVSSAFGAVETTPYQAWMGNTRSSSPVMEASGFEESVNSSNSVDDSLPVGPPLSDLDLEAQADHLTLVRQYWMSGGKPGVRNRCHLAMNELRLLQEDSPEYFNNLSPLARMYYKLLQTNRRVSPARLEREWRRISCHYVRETWSPRGERYIPSNMPRLFVPIPTRFDILFDLDLFGLCTKPSWVLQHIAESAGLAIQSAYAAEYDLALTEMFLSDLQCSWDDCTVQSGEKTIVSEISWAIINICFLSLLLSEFMHWFFSSVSYTWVDVRIFSSIFVCGLVMRSSRLPSYREFSRLRISCLITFGIIVALASLSALGKAYRSNDAGDGPLSLGWLGLPFLGDIQLDHPEDLFDWLLPLTKRDRHNAVLMVLSLYLLLSGDLDFSPWLLLPCVPSLLLVLLHYTCNYYVDIWDTNSFLRDNPWFGTFCIYLGLGFSYLPHVLCRYEHYLSVLIVAHRFWHQLGKEFSSNDAGDGPLDFWGPFNDCDELHLSSPEPCYLFINSIIGWSRLETYANKPDAVEDLDILPWYLYWVALAGGFYQIFGVFVLLSKLSWKASWAWVENHNVHRETHLLDLCSTVYHTANDVLCSPWWWAFTFIFVINRGEHWYKTHHPIGVDELGCFSTSIEFYPAMFSVLLFMWLFLECLLWVLGSRYSTLTITAYLVTLTFARISSCLKLQLLFSQRMNSSVPSGVSLENLKSLVEELQTKLELDLEAQAGSDVDDDYVEVENIPGSVFESELRNATFLKRQLTEYQDIVLARIPNADVDEIVRKVEGLCIFIRSWSKAKTREDQICACMSLCHSWFKGSVSGTIFKCASDIFAGENLQSPAHEAPYSIQGGWDVCREKFKSWKDLLDSPFGVKMHEFFALCTYGGILTALGLSVKTDAFKRYYKETKLHEKWSASIYLQLIDNAMFIIERIGDFLYTWEISSLLHADDEARKLDAEFAFLKGNFGCYKSGGLERNVVVDEGIERPVVSDAEYRNRVFELLSTMRLKNQKFTTQRMNTPERVIFTRKLEDLERMSAEIIAGVNSRVMREAPFAVTLSGYTGQSKSCVVTYMSKVIAKAYQLTYRDSMVVNINAKDKFQSEVKTSHMGIILDDFANTRAEFVKDSPTDQIIDIVNNVRKYVLKADVGEKGMVQWNNLWLIATTNVPSLDVGSYSNEPAAVLRRFVYHISMSVKTAYAKPKTHVNEINMLDPEKMEGEVIRDAWDFTVRTTTVLTPGVAVNEECPGVTPCRALFTIARGVTEPGGEEKELKNISIHELCYLLGHSARRHAQVQTGFINAIADLERAELCDCFKLRHQCAIHALQVQSGDISIPMIISSHRFLVEAYCWMSDFWNWCSPSFRCVLDFGRYQMRFLFERYGESLDDARIFKWILGRNNYTLSYVQIGVRVCFQMFLSAWPICILLLRLLGFSLWNCVIYGAFVALVFTISEWATIVKRVSFRVGKAAISDVRKAINTRYLLGFTVLSGLLWLCWFMKGKDHPSLQVQGGHFSTPAPDKIRKPDIWVKSDLLQCLPLGTKARNMTMVDFQDVVSRSQVYVRSSCGGGRRRFTNGIFLKSNFLLVPYHLLLTSVGFATDLEIHFAPLDKTGSHFKIKVGPEVVARVPNRDLAVIYTARGGPRKDLLEMGAFPEEIIHMPRLGVSELYRSPEGEVLLHKYCAESSKFNDDTRPEVELRGEFESYVYMRPSPTFDGLCGATLCTKIGGGPCIIGFHQLGRTGAETGVACAVAAPMLRHAIEKLKAKCPLVFETADVCPDFPFVPNSAEMSTPLAISDTIDPKSVTNQLPAGSSVISLGKHNQPRRSMRSQVELTPIAELVSEECGVPITHDKPLLLGKLKGWYDNLVPCTGSYQFIYKYLSLAYIDLSDHITEAVRSNLDVFGVVRPYTLKVVTSGFPGARGVNPMKLNTSMGWPYLKPKKRFLFRGEPEDDYPDGPIEVPENIMEDVERARDICRSGNRPGTIFTACQKDEPTKIGKEKVRIFTSSNIILSILVRQYYLPIARIIIQYPLLFYMAVGMNCYGTDWCALYEYLAQFGKERVFAGDFEKYDKRFEYQLQIMCWSILIRVAEIFGYDEEDLTIMRSLAEDIARAFWEFNGEFQCVETANSSGHDLTVVINGLGNALQSMYCFYKAIPEGDLLPPPTVNSTRVTFEKLMPDLNWSFLDELDGMPVNKRLRGRFSRYAALVTLGDDNVISVSPSCSWFNHMTMSSELAEIGLSYTTADKTTPTEPFEGMDRVSFLKRRFVHHSDIGRVVAPIEEGSIWKSLFCYKRDSPVVWELHCADQIDGALREFCLYGEGVFEQRRTQLERVAKRADILHYFKNSRLFTYRELVGWYTDLADE